MCEGTRNYLWPVIRLQLFKGDLNNKNLTKLEQTHHSYTPPTHTPTQTLVNRFAIKWSPYCFSSKRITKKGLFKQFHINLSKSMWQLVWHYCVSRVVATVGFKKKRKKEKLLKKLFSSISFRHLHCLQCLITCRVLQILKIGTPSKKLLNRNYCIFDPPLVVSGLQLFKGDMNNANLTGNQISYM